MDWYQPGAWSTALGALKEGRSPWRSLSEDLLMSTLLATRKDSVPTDPWERNCPRPTTGQASTSLADIDVYQGSPWAITGKEK